MGKEDIQEKQQIFNGFFCKAMSNQKTQDKKETLCSSDVCSFV